MSDFMTATYSPEDNKLRLYSAARLDPETYAKVRAAGFTYAPKQELFVAPMWTPAREDFLLGMCGEIGDEDTSLAERAEGRADRFEGYQGKRRAEAGRAREAVESIAGGIPFGQPILVGHHSERRARKDAEKIETGMRNAVRLWDCAEYWQSRAKGALQHAQYKERPDVRHRRIKGLEADKRKQERAKADSEIYLSMWSVDGLDLAGALKIANFDHLYFRLEPGDESTVSAWSALKDGKIEVADAQERAAKAHVRAIKWADRWITHYGNRIAYERAMLGEQGGLVAEQHDIKAGGRVLIGGEWLVVVRVNKREGKTVSVTTNARYVRVRGIEQVKGYREPSEEDAEKIQAVKKLPPLCNYPGENFLVMTADEWKRKPADYKQTRTSPADETRGAHRVRMAVIPGTGFKLAQVFISDQKRTDPPAATVSQVQPAAFVREIVTPAVTAPRDTEQQPERVQVEALRAQLKTGIKVVSAPQLFPTPAPLAKRMVELADIEPGQEVLEPSFGTQRILRAIRAYGPQCTVTAVEVNYAMANDATTVCADRVVCADFLQCADLGSFDRVLMNPPFADAQDIAHIQQARALLKPGGVLVAICVNGPRQNEKLRPLVEGCGGVWEPLPGDTFKESGTQVNTVLLTLHG